MKVVLSTAELERLFNYHNNCIVIPDCDGVSCTFNKSDDGYYIVRWEEYDPCTAKMNIKELLEYVNGEFTLYTEDYKYLYENADFI